MSTTESQTRKEIIDLKLRAAGWEVDDCTQVVQEFGIKREAPTEVREAYDHYLPKTTYPFNSINFRSL